LWPGTVELAAGPLLESKSYRIQRRRPAGPRDSLYRLQRAILGRYPMLLLAVM